MEAPRSRKKKKTNPVVKAGIFCAAAAVIGLCAFRGAYAGKYLPGSTVNGKDVSSMLFSDVKAQLENEYREQHKDFTITDEAGREFKVNLDGKIRVYADTLEAEEENRGLLRFKGKSMTIDIAAEPDAGFEAEVEALLNGDEFKTEPQNAYLYYTDQDGTLVMPQIRGTMLHDKFEIASEIKDAVKDGRSSYKIEDRFYEQADVTVADLMDEYHARKKFEETKLTYDIHGTPVTVDRHIFHEWMNEDGTMDKEKVMVWATDIAKETDTAYTSRTMTLRDKEFTVQGPFGWRINKEAWADELMERVMASEDYSGEPPYSIKGGSGEYGLTDTFVEVDISEQHVWVYKDGEIVADSACVTGTATDAERASDPGIYPITYTQKNATLKGPGYESFVHYWMPYNGGEGLHDATWRSKFGGTIYKYSGSHGCINLPLDFAKKVYGAVKQGDAVIVHQ